MAGFDIVVQTWISKCDYSVIPWGNTTSPPIAWEESLENHGMVWVGGDLPNLVPTFHLPFSFFSVIQRTALTPTAETGRNRPSSSSVAFISPPLPAAGWEQPHSRAEIPTVAACPYVKWNIPALTAMELQ